MAQVTVSLNGWRYDIACDDGQEEHLTRLASYVDKRVTELVASVGQVGEARLLVMASLLVADELADAYSRLDALRDNPAAGTDPAESERVRAASEAAAAEIESLARRVEDVADRLKAT